MLLPVMLTANNIMEMLILIVCASLLREVRIPTLAQVSAWPGHVLHMG
jgi:hypothetical protein